jgi:hypothetical protein
MMKHPLLLLFSTAALFAGMTGCSGHVGLSGTVVYSDSGEPVTSGEIQFSAGTFLARAMIQPNGSFRTGTYKASDGLPPGTYNVAIYSVNEHTIPLIHPRYGDWRTSELTITVDKTTTGVEFKVDRPEVDFSTLRDRDLRPPPASVRR